MSFQKVFKNIFWSNIIVKFEISKKKPGESIFIINDRCPIPPYWSNLTMCLCPSMKGSHFQNINVMTPTKPCTKHVLKNNIC